MRNEFRYRGGSGASAPVTTDVAGPAWTEVIDDAIGSLEALNASTEEGFLTAGARLQEIFTRIMGISGGLTDVISAFTSEANGDLRARLHGVTKTASRLLDNFESTSTNAAAHLKQMRTAMEDLPDTLKEFDRLVSQLRIMGITTRIETERLGLTHMGFEHLAEDVTTLGETISVKAKEVQSSLRSITSIVRGNEQNLVHLRQKHADLRKSVIHTMDSDMQLLSEKHEILMKVVENVSTHSQDAMQTLNLIVGAIQFHDITRQQIEHVIEALRDLRREHPDGDTAAASHLIVVCGIEPAQLASARTEFTEAVLSMISSFGSLAATVKVMQSESREAIGSSGSEGETFFSVVGENLRSVTQALGEGERTIHEFLEALEEIDKVVQKMKRYMEEMSEVGVEVELLALNSRVRAAKALERGAALGVIAERIQQISTVSQSHIETVVASIAALVAETEEMKQIAMNAERTRTAGTSIASMTADLDEMSRIFESNSASAADVLGRTDALSGVLGTELEELAGLIRRSRTEIDVTQRIEEDLRVLESEARASAPDAVIEESARMLEEMRARYTMHSERDIHAAYLEGRMPGEAGAGQPDSSIELF